MSAPEGSGFVPGQIFVGDGDLVEISGSRIELVVTNTADRPIQVGSHFHFAEANAALSFGRDVAWGHRLAISAGTAVRFEPGIERVVALTPLRGRRVVPGLRGRAGGPLDPVES